MPNYSDENNELIINYIKKLIMENGGRNERTENSFDLNCVDSSKVDRSVRCEFKNDALLNLYKIQLNSSSSITLRCNSVIPLISDVTPRISSKKALGNDNVSINNITGPNIGYDPINSSFYLEYYIDITGTRIGFTSLKLESGAISNEVGEKNKETKSGTIWVKILKPLPPISNGCN